ncbi:hypothetical protein C1708_12750 [Streptomyces sp. DH-12]|uniref:RNA polymerase sigma factor n=1 Tax=Streptomyces sp. DH-12 TaxID=2072509 RepID=UPI000CCDCC06|nr:sigma factor [Streptomyces sp. DH-12]PNV33084.1 hypothetical protein C1708_12750 [Streptomyces sp. DH-12]
MRTREGGRIVDEAAVIARVRAGQPEAYAELVRAHTGIALRAAAALGAGADAEDVVQQAFVKAYCALGRFKGGAAFRPWLLSIVANETRNTVRAAARRTTLAGSAAPAAQPTPREDLHIAPAQAAAPVADGGADRWWAVPGLAAGAALALALRPYALRGAAAVRARKGPDGRPRQELPDA